MIVGLVALGAALSAVGGWRYARASAPVSGPIVLLSVDALRADRLPVYGYTKIKTPAIDALAKDGVVFDRAYSHAPQTLPAHTSLLSGRLPHETGVRDNAGFIVKGDERMLAEMLEDRGYSTGAVVSSYALREATGIAQGFTFFDDDLPEGDAGDPGGGLTRGGEESVAIAEDWLANAGTERAFLFLHLHQPYRAPSSPSRPGERYDVEVAHVDEIIGGFIRHLKAHQLYDQSTIILVADHGEGLGDHGETGHGVLAHEEAVRIPLIIKPAAGKGAGRRVTALVQHVDIVPTILDLAKAPIPDRLSGLSLNRLVEGDSDTPARVVYSESLFTAYRFGWPGVRTVTDGRYRLVRAETDELYDIVADPAARRNIARDQLGELTRLRNALERFAIESPLHVPVPEKPDVQARLAALGSVGPVARVAADDDADVVDPADQVAIIETYRAAVAYAVEREWPAAIERLETLLRQHPRLAIVWHELGDIAMGAGRFDRAVDAYRHAAALRPGGPEDHLSAATALLRLRRLDESRQQAEFAVMTAATEDRASRAAAHELLARIALLRREASIARAQARLAHQADPTLPMPAYIDGRLLYDAGRFAEAVAVFQSAIGEIDKSGTSAVYELHYYTGDALVRLERTAEAEYHLLEELRAFPGHARARGALATLYHQTGRIDEAGEVLTAMLRISPTPDAYALAARLWTTFGNLPQAAATRAEAARIISATPRRAGTGPAQ